MLLRAPVRRDVGRGRCPCASAHCHLCCSPGAAEGAPRDAADQANANRRGFLAALQSPRCLGKRRWRSPAGTHHTLAGVDWT